MRLKHLLSILFLFFSPFLFAQPVDFLWGNHTSGTGSKNPNALITDASKNVYAGGSFSGTVVINTGNNPVSLTASASTNAFIYRIDPAGQFDWVIRFTGSGASTLQDLAIDDQGMLYAYGQFSGTVDFNPDPNTTENKTSAGGNDLFLVKLNPNGQLQWARTFSSVYNSLGYRLKINNNNDLFIGGTFGDSLHWNSGSFAHDIYGPNTNNLYIAKLDSSGTVQWATKYTTSYNSIFIRDLDVSKDNDVYFTGGFRGNCDFDPDPAASTILSSPSNSTIYLSSLSDSGTFRFAFKLSGNGYATSAGYSVVCGKEHVYLGGSCQGWYDFDPGSGFDTASAEGGGNSDVFVAKYTNSGQLVNYGIIGGNNADIMYEIAVDSFENIYGCGSIVDSCDLDPGAGQSFVKAYGSGGLGDIVGFMFKWDSNFNYQWSRGIVGTSYSALLRISLDDTGSIYFNSTFRGQNDYNPTQDTNNFTATSADILTVKWGQCQRYERTDSVFACGSYSWHTKLLDSSGVYIDTLLTNKGCDSITTLVLEIYPTLYQASISSCDSFVWNGTAIYSSGIYTDTLLSSTLCDSIVELDLSISNSVLITQHVQGCDSLIFQGNTYFSSMDVYDTLRTSFGCDSIIESRLTVHYSESIPLSYVACDSFAYNGIFYYQDTLLFDTLSKTTGCDSVLEVDIIIHSTFVNFMQDTACGSYVWHGRTLNSSGIYYDSLKASTGCDSLFVLQLQIENLNDSIFAITNGLEAFETGVSYQWLDCSNSFSVISGQRGKTFYPSLSGTYAAEISGSRCIDTTSCKQFITIGLDEGIQTSQIVVYPNPGDGQITLSGLPASVSRIEVYTADGRLLYKKQDIDTSELRIMLDGEAGLYFIRIMDAKGKFETLRYVKCR